MVVLVLVVLVLVLVLVMVVLVLVLVVVVVVAGVVVVVVVTTCDSLHAHRGRVSHHIQSCKAARIGAARSHQLVVSLDVAQPLPAVTSTQIPPCHLNLQRCGPSRVAR